MVNVIGLGYIGLPTALMMASHGVEVVGTDYNEELHRTIIHGILHLCGINDKGPGEREIMEENENRALAILPEECRG